MRNLRSQNKVKVEGGMSSMTDLVFLLLIFFIVLSTMVSPPNIPLNLPSSTPPSNTNVPQDVIKVSVSKNNEIFVGPKANLVSMEYLEQAIINEVITTGDSIVELSGDQGSNWQYNVAVIDVAKKNFLKLVIKTKF